jgi:hypothetical protein
MFIKMSSLHVLFYRGGWDLGRDFCIAHGFFLTLFGKFLKLQSNFTLTMYVSAFYIYLGNVSKNFIKINIVFYNM